MDEYRCLYYELLGKMKKVMESSIIMNVQIKVLNSCTYILYFFVCIHIYGVYGIIGNYYSCSIIYIFEELP